MGKFIDLSNKTFQELTVLEKDEELSNARGRIYWKCQCSCGRIKSYRTDILKRVKTCGECKKDLTNQRFGRLIALQKGKKDKASHQFWICQCDCGNKVEVNSDNLRRGLTQSCGCLHSELTHEAVFKDITGQKFGKLTPISYKIINSKTYWVCQCDCGNTTVVAGSNLKNKHTQSCGCITKSIGEQNIENILLTNNIQYFKEYSFSDLPNRRFDFYLPDYNRLIEFDGPQHIKYSKNWYQTYEEWKQALDRDYEKNEYALTYNIELVRIPYNERDSITLEMLIGSQYLVINNNILAEM